MATPLMECGNYFINVFGIWEGGIGFFIFFFVIATKDLLLYRKKWLLWKLTAVSVVNLVALATAFHPEDNIQEIILSLHF